jgi:hypothetical protein
MHKYLKITYSHWYFEELQVLTEVVLVHYVCVNDKTDLFHLPALALHRVAHGAPEGC